MVTCAARNPASGLAEGQHDRSSFAVMSKPEDYTLEDHFKSLALRLRAKAFSEKTGVGRAELQRLAECYMQLAEDECPRDYFQKS